MIGIGNHFGGPEQKISKIHTMLNKAMNIAADMRNPDFDDGSQGWINPIFMVQGSLFKPDFEGLKLGYFSRKKKGLVVMIAVPENIVHGNDIPQFVGNSLRDAAKLAANKFAASKIEFPLTECDQIIDEIQSELVKLNQSVSDFE
jgi:hypothetical protein